MDYLGIITKNYHLVYQHSEKLRFIGIMAYPKTVEYYKKIFKIWVNAKEGYLGINFFYFKRTITQTIVDCLSLFKKGKNNF